jgi:hypothetical protein
MCCLHAAAIRDFREPLPTDTALGPTLSRPLTAPQTPLNTPRRALCSRPPPSFWGRISQAPLLAGHSPPTTTPSFFSAPLAHRDAVQLGVLVCGVLPGLGQQAVVPVDVVGVEAQLALFGVLLDGRGRLVLGWKAGGARREEQDDKEGGAAGASQGGCEATEAGRRGVGVCDTALCVWTKQARLASDPGLVPLLLLQVLRLVACKVLLEAVLLYRRSLGCPGCTCPAGKAPAEGAMWHTAARPALLLWAPSRCCLGPWPRCMVPGVVRPAPVAPLPSPPVTGWAFRPAAPAPGPLLQCCMVRCAVSLWHMLPQGCLLLGPVFLQPMPFQRSSVFAVCL